MIKAVIFDMDGLLIDSEPLWRKAEKEVFSEVGIKVKNEEFQKTMGVRIDALVEYWFERFPWKSTSKKEVETSIISKVVEMIKKEGILMPGAMETLKKLKKMNMPMAIASSSSAKIINAVLDKTSIREYISVAHSAENERFGKPYPDVYLGTSKKLGVCARRCLAFEDSPNGVIAAKTAGMKCVAVPAIEARNDLAMSKADLVIGSLLDFDEEFILDLNKEITFQHKTC